MLGGMGRRAVWAIVLFAAGTVLTMQGSASAACGTGVTDMASLTGDVVSTSIAKGTGTYVVVRKDDGSTAQALFWGRDPTNTFPGGVENTIEEAWPGRLPEVGGRYTIVGAPGGDALSVNLCVTGVGVAQLAAPPATVATSPATSDGASGGDGSTTGVVVVVAGAAVVIVALLVLRRRSVR